MTTLLKQAFSEASKLPEIEQNSFARWILEELVSEAKWAQAFADSEETLSQLAKEAADEYAAGKTKTLDLKTL